MRKILLLISVICLLSGSALAHETGVIIQKQVNGDYKTAYVVNYDMGGLPKVYLNTQAVFVAPRSDFTKLNHELFEATFGSTFGILKGELSLNTGAQYWWDGNSQGKPGGQIDWTNQASLLWRW